MGNTDEQPILKKTGTVALIALLCATPPLATDLYMPSLPTMTAQLGTTQSLASLTMTLFFCFMAAGMLLLGPLSDRFGRKPILIPCTSIAFAFSLACAFAPNIHALLAFRAAQGFASGGMVALATTLVKDCFHGKRMATMLSITQAIALIAPAVAPSIGALILGIAGWRGEFGALALLMGISLAGSLALKEPWPKEFRLAGGVAAAFKGLARSARDGKIRGLVLTGALMSAPFMAYINVASYVYIDLFDLSENVFGVFFAANAVVGIAGSLAYMRASSVKTRKTLQAGIVISAVCATAMLIAGSASAVVFLLCMAPFTFMQNFSRPLITNVLMRDAGKTAGSVSSFVNFTWTALGCAGMASMSLGWSGYTFGLGSVMMIGAALSLLAWLPTRKHV